jgi:putative SOS response-associated peptidase YedK
MCTNYRPTARDHLREHFGVADPDFDYPEESYPGYRAPVIRRFRDAARACLAAGFGLIPHWAKDASIARNTYNARSETVAERPSFRSPWRQGQFCLVPMDAFYEPCYESGKSVRWRIAAADGLPFAVAGLWERWLARETGEVLHSFTMLTVNADGHPVMGRMHKPGDEKRSLVLIGRAHYDDWLGASPASAHEMLRAPAADALVAEASPRPPVRRGRG